MTGWEKCDELKKIRKQIADANGIPYEIEKCEHLEACIGTCPKCDAEIKYISDELAKKEAAGVEVVLDGIAGDAFQGNGAIEAFKLSGEGEETFNAEMGDVDVETEIINGGLEDPDDYVDGGIGNWGECVDEEAKETPLADLNLSMRSHNCLVREGIKTIESLTAISKEDLSDIEDLNDKCIEEIIEKLSEKGFSLAEHEILMGMPIMTEIVDGGIGSWGDFVDEELPFN